MKKLLLLIPVLALMATGCSNTGDDDSSSSSSSSSTTATTSQSTSTSTSTGSGDNSGKVIEYDFNDVNEDFYLNSYGTMEAPYINKCSDEGTLGFFNDHCKGNGDLMTAADNTSASAGNAGDSGAFPNEHGCVKIGTGKKEGVLALTFSVAISKVEITCHDWYKKDDSHPTNSNKVDINGDQKLAPYTTGPSKTESLVFNIDPSADVVITSTGLTNKDTGNPYGRIFIFNIKLTVA